MSPLQNKTKKKAMFTLFFRVFWVVILLFSLQANAQPIQEYSPKDNYEKLEYNISVRDGIKLYVAVYVPKNNTQPLPFLIKRTPYGCGPYGPDKFPGILGPQGDHRFAKEGYIFVCQDVRGRWMSEGTFTNMTPAIPNVTGHRTVDESTDTYDTVEFLLRNIPHNNGKIGLHGISYPGFYVAASIINSHPAIVAASPQAPIADWFVGDDFHANGAFYLQDAFNFFSGFEHPEPTPTQKRGPSLRINSDDAYAFFLRLGALPNANARYFKGSVDFWNTFMKHGTYDQFWQERNIVPHLKGVKTNVMTVIGAFDAEDPYGGYEIYRSIGKLSPETTSNRLVLGPWFHGGWERSEGDFLGNVPFVQKTAVQYRASIDLPFFNYYLKGKGSFDQANVRAFATGSNDWHNFDIWPPKEARPTTWFLTEQGGLSTQAPSKNSGNDRYVSDPAKPVPYSQRITYDRTREYMTEDQRFAASRPDVLVYETEVLSEDFTLAGPVDIRLFVSTTGSDADFVVKVVDVFPDSTKEVQSRDKKYLPNPLAGYQMLVRYAVMRSKFRNNFSKPEPLQPGKVTEVRWKSPHIFHTFKKGHRLMIQVQSSFFPLIDRNPQVFLDIYNAKDSDFKAQTHTIYRSAQYPSSITVGRISPK